MFQHVLYLLALSHLPAATLAAEVLDFDDYRVPYQPAQVGRCKLASADEAYEYTILAEDYLVQTNLVATIGAENPEAYYEENIAPRQANNFEVLAPSVGLELSGDDVRQLFLNLSTRRLASGMPSLRRTGERLFSRDGKCPKWRRRRGRRRRPPRVHVHTPRFQQTQKSATSGQYPRPNASWQ